MLLEASPAVLVYVGIILVVVLYVVDQQVLAPKVPTPAVYPYEPEGRNRFSFRTRLRLYMDCVGLYRGAWEKVYFPCRILHSVSNCSSLVTEVSLTMYFT